MKLGIVVCTYVGYENWLQNLLNPFKGGSAYPLYVVMNGVKNLPDKNGYLDAFKKCFLQYPVSLLEGTDNFEVGAIHDVILQTDLDEFLFLQASMEVKDFEIFEIVFRQYLGRSVAITPKFFHFLGK